MSRTAMAPYVSGEWQAERADIHQQCPIDGSNRTDDIGRLSQARARKTTRNNRPTSWRWYSAVLWLSCCFSAPIRWHYSGGRHDWLKPFWQVRHIHTLRLSHTRAEFLQLWGVGQKRKSSPARSVADLWKTSRRQDFSGERQSRCASPGENHKKIDSFDNRPPDYKGKIAKIPCVGAGGCAVCRLSGDTASAVGSKWRAADDICFTGR